MTALLLATSLLSVFDFSIILKAMDRDEIVRYQAGDPNLAQLIAIDDCGLGYKLLSTTAI